MNFSTTCTCILNCRHKHKYFSILYSPLKNHNCLLLSFSDRTLAASGAFWLKPTIYSADLISSGSNKIVVLGFSDDYCYGISRPYCNLINLLGVFHWSSFGSCGCCDHRLTGRAAVTRTQKCRQKNTVTSRGTYDLLWTKASSYRCNWIREDRINLPLNYEILSQ